MRVILKGRPQTGWAKELTCTGSGNGGGGCGALLLVEAADLFQTERWIMGRDYETYATFACPECTVLTDVDDPTAHSIARAYVRPRVTSDEMTFVCSYCRQICSKNMFVKCPERANGMHEVHLCNQGCKAWDCPNL